MYCFSSEKKNQKQERGGVFFLRQKMTLDHVYNEWTETV